MSNYLQKYHLKKVEPVKGRAKITFQDYLKMHQRPAKTGVIKTQIKRKIQHRTFPQKQQQKTLPTVHKTEKYIKYDNNFFQEEANTPLKRQLSPKSKNLQRSHKSLNFKSLKDSSTGVNILNSIQDFFIKIMRTNEGCSCSEPCPWASKFFRWVEVPLDIIKNHYVNLLLKWQQSLKSPQVVADSYSNQMSRKSSQSIKSLQENSRQNLKQILKDIDRTQSESSTFQNTVFKERQRNILMCYATEDTKVGYIQGMNIILSGIIFHVKDEIKSYAIFRGIILKIRNIYLNNFKECYMHISKIKEYLHLHVNDVYEMFEQIMVDVNIVCLPWVLSILTCIVPLESLHLIYDGFIKQQWEFFYKVCLAIFIYHKEEILSLNDSGDIHALLSPTNDKKNSYDWQDIIMYSHLITL